MKDSQFINNKYLYDFSFFNEPKRFNDLILYQIGEIYCNNSAVVESHMHDNFFELTFVLRINVGEFYIRECDLNVDLMLLY